MRQETPAVVAWNEAIRPSGGCASTAFCAARNCGVKVSLKFDSCKTHACQPSARRLPKAPRCPKLPKTIGHASGHRGRHAKRLMDAHKVSIHHVKRDSICIRNVRFWRSTYDVLSGPRACLPLLSRKLGSPCLAALGAAEAPNATAAGFFPAQSSGSRSST